MLPGAGHSSAESEFLDHMIEVRQMTEPEPSLAAKDQTYLAVAQASAIRPDDLAVAKRAVGVAGEAIDAAGVRTMFHLLDQQTDPAQLRQGAHSLVLMVARLLASKQLPLADWVLAELSARADRIDLTGLFAVAATPEALGGLMDAVIADPSLEPMGEQIVTLLGEPAVVPFVNAAISRKAEGLRLAEKLFGKRMMEPLNNAALQAEWFQLAPVVTRLTVEGDSRCAATIEALVRRHDAQGRKEIITGLNTAGGPLAQKILGEMVGDPTPEIAILAARSLAKSGMPGSGAPIAARIQQLDLDNSDFELGRELINALARTPDAIADELLNKLASRRSIMKRGRFNDVQAAVAAARQLRSREAVGR
jgi:ribosome-binding factor A